jgi:hypothetical protein
MLSPWWSGCCTNAPAARGIPDAVLAANLGMLSPALAPLATA